MKWKRNTFYKLEFEAWKNYRSILLSKTMQENAKNWPPLTRLTHIGIRTEKRN